MSYMNKISIDDLELAGKQVLVRVDYNVPISDGQIKDDRRIRATLPTIRKLLEAGAIPVLMSHLGRPDGKRDVSLSLEPVAKKLGELIGRPVTFVSDCIGEEARIARERATKGDILLLENLRFHKGEKENDEAFSKELAGDAEIYINDAFGTSHRAHASMVGVTRFVKTAAAGYLLKRELDMLVGLLENPQRPYIAVIGGSKVSSKIGILENLLEKCDRVLIGGSMACTFLTSLGIPQGESLVEHNSLDVARQILEKAEEFDVPGGKVFLPIDEVVTDQINDNGIKRVEAYDQIPSNLKAVDIGPDTVARYRTELETAGTIIMNGPMGVFEINKFAEGTREILKVLAARVENGATAVLGGGDSAAAAAKFGFQDRMTHISTGGGASLKLLEGSPLPGVEALTDKK
ncbi:phosphoglycerate kinase [bacterium]|nr:MAG: phosphoglycerate kinase [bacterium]